MICIGISDTRRRGVCWRRGWGGSAGGEGGAVAGRRHGGGVAPRGVVAAGGAAGAVVATRDPPLQRDYGGTVDGVAPAGVSGSGAAEGRAGGGAADVNEEVVTVGGELDCIDGAATLAKLGEEPREEGDGRVVVEF